MSGKLSLNQDPSISSVIEQQKPPIVEPGVVDKFLSQAAALVHRVIEIPQKTSDLLEQISCGMGSTAISSTESRQQDRNEEINS